MKSWLACVLALSISACAQDVGEQPPPSTSPSTSTLLVADGYTGRVSGFGFVLESPRHGPQLCWHVAMSLPPQCSGPDVVGWKWDGVKSESAQGTRWGNYQVTGTWDGKRLTLTGPARQVPQVATPTPSCGPPGGTELEREQAAAELNRLTAELNRVARQSPDFAGVWLDCGVPHASFTKDVVGNEARLRQVWQGPLRVIQARHTEVDLQHIVTDVRGMPGVLGAGVTARQNAVQVDVFVATASRQRELDARFGQGTVVQKGVLTPID